MANGLTKALAGDSVDKAVAQINDLNIEGLSAKTIKRKRKKFTKKQLDAIKKAREELKGLRGEGR